ncbi:SusC/RagA family TonB-linked outer membrane protein [Chitinophaga agrisoli]|uniref:SusC/RagA family TonB-linked outer membrane protein n=1 Tax=Chitinophaga agrisoli TaxID=2607653 RepID=A0A5B2W2U6_9BACT|nr:SusC/RagA family TonB-linked outer membrane protein [Chitinophaga agrisoli]KAA2244817.1 SusC/RagA family TonB-linked outer membrane protein [Chitinophaga agrisoli]
MAHPYSSLHKGLAGAAICLLLCNSNYAQNVYKNKDTTGTAATDSIGWLKKTPLLPRDTTGHLPNNELFLPHPQIGAVSAVDMNETKKLPYTSIDQMLAGRVTGVDIRTPSAEPGKRTSVFIRGASTLLLKNSDVFYAQPTYVVDGIPLVPDHPFPYDIQRFDLNRMGTEINLLSFLDVNDIASIEVLKDFAASAKYGPLAANGIVNITTKGPRSGRMKVTVNSWVGLSLQPRVKTVNGEFERDFRMPFYQKYANETQWRNFPRYLADSTQDRYFGASDWDEVYYRNGWSNGIQAAVSGGTRLANFRFSLGRSAQQGVADRTGMNRYDVNFGVNLMPVKHLMLTTYISGATVTRSRNEFIRDRAGDEDYLVNFESPPSPNKQYFQSYFTAIKDGINKNRNNNARVLANLHYDLSPHWSLNSRFSIDYTQNFRDLFIPTYLNDGNNFVSNFDGLSRRMMLDNSVRYDNTFADKHHLDVTVGQLALWDKWRYDYGRAYKGRSDYIKIYKPGDDANKEGVFGNLRLQTNYKDYTQSNLASFYTNVGYNYAGKYFVNLYLRRDGSSNVPAAHRWLFSPTLSAAWKISKEDFLQQAGWLSNLNLRASYGRVGRVLMDEYYKGGPIYNVDIGWNGNPNMATYNAFPAINAGFGTGYVTDDLKWPYVEQWNLGLDIGLLHDRIHASLDVYAKTDKDLLLKIPVMEESGYTGLVKNGMDIRNFGYELALDAAIIQGPQFGWTTSLSVYTNQNKLLAMPDGVQDMTIGNRRLLVDKPTDRYWLLINEGIYNTDADIPINPSTGKKMSYQGVALHAGDPIWKDLNGDYVINDADRVMKGRQVPAAQGYFSNTFRYRQLELQVLCNYAFGRKIINQAMADRFDFAAREGADDIKGIKEVNYWAKVDGDYDKYPLYNPWSAVNAYQPDQTLFLEDGSFVKLRAITLAYNLRASWMERRGIEQLRIYATANNVATWTPYTGGDPEAVDYFGYDQGYYNWPAPRSFTLGFNFQF